MSLEEEVGLREVQREGTGRRHRQKTTTHTPRRETAEEASLPTPPSQTSRFQDYKKVNFCRLSPPPVGGTLLRHPSDLIDGSRMLNLHLLLLWPNPFPRTNKCLPQEGHAALRVNTLPPGPQGDGGWGRWVQRCAT